MAEDVLEVVLALGHLFHQLVAQLGALALVDLDAALHALEDRPEELLLELIHWLEAQLGDGAGGLLADFPRVHTVGAVVDPALRLGDARVNHLAVVLPILEVVAVHGGLESEGLGQAAKRRVVADHRVLRAARDEVPMAVGVLRVVQTVLPADLHARVSQHLVQGEDDAGLLVGICPIAVDVRAAHERDDESLGERPAQADALNVPSRGLNVEVDPLEVAALQALPQIAQASEGLVQRFGDLKLPLRHVLVGGGRALLGSALQVEDSQLALGEVTEDQGRVERRDQLARPGLVLRAEQTCGVQLPRDGALELATSPLGDTLVAGQSPHGCVAQGDDHVGLDFVDFLQQAGEALVQDGLGPQLAKLAHRGLDVLALASQPGVDLVAGRPAVDNVGGVTLAAHDARLVEHAVQLHAGRALEGEKGALLLHTPGLADEHDAGRDRSVTAVRVQTHCVSPLYRPRRAGCTQH